MGMPKGKGLAERDKKEKAGEEPALPGKTSGKRFYASNGAFGTAVDFALR
jgi:hypothetical protein